MALPLTSTTTTTAVASPAATHAAVAVERLSHRYPPARRRGRRGAAPATVDRPALDDITLEIQPGEIFGILGPNGGGKTTLFRILSTMLRPHAGEGASPGSAHIFGHDVLRESQTVRALLGVVFQNPSLDGKLTVQENLVHQARLYGLGGRDMHQRIDRWLERFDLLDRRHQDTEHLSGGLRRRVELAKALLHEPRLLLMDEPATGLDPGARRDLWQHLRRLRDESGATIAVTTHLMDEAEHCDRLAIIASGKLVAVDTPASLKAQIGGDVITIEPDPIQPDNTPERVASLITERFGPWDADAKPRVIDGVVRFETPDGPAAVAAVSSALPQRIRRISAGHPTLEDVFLHLTGFRFPSEE